MESGNGKVIELLERIAGGLDGVNERLDATNGRLDTTNEQMRTGFASVNSRLDNALGFLGRAHGDHEERIRALEERVFEKST